MKFLRVKYYLFIIKIFVLKIRYRKRINFKSIRVGFEGDTQVLISGSNSSITFGSTNYFYRLGNLEALEGGEIVFGNNVSVNKGFSIVARRKIIFGDNIMIGPNVMIYDHDHNFAISDTPFRLQNFSSKPITIGSNVWIGANVFIKSGLSIGTNTVIAAGAVVTRSIPDDCLVGGNPAKILRRLNG